MSKRLTSEDLAVRLATLGQVQLQKGVAAQLQAAASLLEELRCLDLIEELIREPRRIDWFRRQLYGWVHLGFLVPAETYKELPALTASVGFDQAQSSFRSEVMTLELSALLGRAVKTSVFEVFRFTNVELTKEVALGLEAFAPEVAPEVSAEWIERGVGAHLGIGLRTSHAVEVVQDWFEEVGFRPAAFLEGRPAVNRAEDIQVLYLDGQVEGRLLRLEFYHSGSQLKLAERWAAKAAGEA